MAVHYGATWAGFVCIFAVVLPTIVSALRIWTMCCTATLWKVIMWLWFACMMAVSLLIVLQLTLVGPTFELMLVKPLSENCSVIAENCSVIAEKWRKCAEHPDEWDVRNNLDVASTVKMYGHCAFVAHQLWNRNCTILQI
jgi:hypothetical protein